MLKHSLLLGTLFCSLSLFAQSPATFRLHLSQEPINLDPNKQNSSSASYLLGNLYRNLLRYDNDAGLVPELAEKCQREKTGDLTCTLKKNLKWSDGSPLTSADFLRTYKKILKPENKAPRADLLFPIKNAQAIYEGKLSDDKLGITTPTPLTLKFSFESSTPEFEYHLSSLVLSPTKENLQVYNGPYVLKDWSRGKKIILENNKFYVTDGLNRPLVEFLFIEEDSVALQLYEKQNLDFLRRLPTLYIPKFKSRPDFVWSPMIRFDYFGFGPELKDREDVRKALTYSLNYPEWQKLFSSEGRPGCAGLPDKWFPKAAPCFDFDLKKIPAITSDKTWTVMFSSLGGDDHKRATEWMQSQWMQNARIKTHIVLKENKIYLQELRKNPPAIFRKGVTPDRPTCLAALETFSSQNPENYIQLKSPEFEKILLKLSSSAKIQDKKKFCLEGVQYLMNRHLLIPTGAIHFSILANEKFIGWKLNEMNELDLSGLRSKP
ncbi:peptide ABC transporter substrate-binding protein [Bdellovibrio sp. HCB2-146]|uniref:peptide ABC transporter substrate-binding protein n=1 Tax=Bdellovibrio sp. HCB2-146 TaxID=3394362 RepID=UPI0039BCCF3D